MSVTVWDSAGVEIVENHAPVRPLGQFWALDRKPEFVLGTSDASGDAGPDAGRDDRDGGGSLVFGPPPV